MKHPELSLLAVKEAAVQLWRAMCELPWWLVPILFALAVAVITLSLGARS